MKNLVVLCILLMFSVWNAHSRLPQQRDIAKTLNDGNIENVSKYFDNVVDVALGAGQTSYSKHQAEMVLRNFFEKNKVQSFSIKYRGDSPADNSFYLIGQLKTVSNEQYKVFLFFKEKNKVHYLQEIKIEQ
ncbi:MAG: DUF4783 domain-containing protein [Edaphocola sp.]